MPNPIFEAQGETVVPAKFETMRTQKMVGTMSPEAEARPAWVSASSVDSSLGTKLLPTVLSLIAGSVDVISFLGLGGLFTVHITGNMAILAAHVVSGGAARSWR